MNNSRKTIAILCAFIAALIVTIFRMQIGRINPNEPSQQLARGQHLVEKIAMCADCHTPRQPNGDFDRTRWLQGASLGFKPLMDMPWAPVAPPIAGLPGYTDQQAVNFFQTGERPDGTQSLPPMPAYRLSEDEAIDVVVYLRSLKAG